MLPTAIIAGMPKCGTSTLIRYLGLHEEICIPKVGATRPNSTELHFFTNANYYNNGIVWYSNFFKETGKEHIAIEKTPNYAFSDIAMKRIHATIAPIKIILILRNPVDRAYSHYWHLRRNGLTNDTFEKVLYGNSYGVDKKNIIMRYGIYHEAFDNVLKYIKPRHVFVCSTKKLRDDPNNLLCELLEFLGTEKIKPPELPKVMYNKGGEPKINRFAEISKYFRKHGFHHLSTAVQLINVRGAISNYVFHADKNTYPPMNKKTRQFLEDYYEPHNKKLSKYGIDADQLLK